MKIPYEVLALQVEKIFKSTEQLTDPAEIESEFKKIQEYIVACGWTLDDYTDRMMGWNSSLN